MFILDKKINSTYMKWPLMKIAEKQFQLKGDNIYDK
jgi:hypothetical protein